MANDTTHINPDNVTTGAPVEGACCFTNFASSPTLPTSASASLGSGWENLGELSDQGYTKSVSLTTNKFKGWHGSTLLTQVESEENTFKAEFVEIARPTVAKLRYGASAVTASASEKCKHHH